MTDFVRDRARWDSIVGGGYGLLVSTADHVERRPTFVTDTVAASAGRAQVGRCR